MRVEREKADLLQPLWRALVVFRPVTPNTLTINVTPVNSPPTGADNVIALNEDDVRVFLAADFGFSDAADNPSPNNFLAVKVSTLRGVRLLGP